MKADHVYITGTLFSWLLLASSASAQMDAPLLEIFIYNYTDGSIEVGDDAQSTIWYNDKKITSQFQSGTFLIPKSDAGGATGNYGFDYAYITYPDDGATDKDTLGYGLYEITVGPVTFHLDLRDANQTGVIDIKIKNDNNGLWWKWYGSCPTGATMGWEEISEGDTLTIWGMFEDCAYWTEGSPNTAPFQPTNPTSLTGDSDENNHPVLTWNANTEIDRAGYKLRRSLDWGPWITIANLSKSATNYIDEDVLKSNEFNNDKYAHYKLFAYNIAANESDYAGPVVVRHSGLVFKQIAENPNSEVVPETFVLHGAFPNPFNAATTIHYALPEFSYVEITVFDIMGREVTTLINGFVNAGFKERVWDGANASGQPVPSGMYFYRLDARAIESGERFYQTRKMVLLR